jgi:predicted ATPase
MDGKRLIEKIRLRNILSFGDKGEEITLEPLNIIIGQNASGKSNLVDVIKLLRSLPQDKGLANFISKNGGISEWIWKGKKEVDYAEVEVTFKRPNRRQYYDLVFNEEVFSKQANIISELLKLKGDDQEEERIISEKVDFIGNQSILSDQYSNYIETSRNEGLKIKSSIWIDTRVIITRLIKIFADLKTNRSAEIRKPQLPDVPNEFLDEDASNLALVLNDLEHRGDAKDKIIENLKKFNPRIKDYSIRILGGTVQLFIREEGLEKPISAMRLSDGTLRYLCLLAILCHPEPPPLICIEEPETGLHPDILPTIAELMIEASQRTQLIVTTHSDILVSAFSEIPEAVLVCEKDEDGTHFKRLEADKLKVWLEEYTLGEAWLRGAIGGTRW